MSFARIQAIGESVTLAEGGSAEFAFDVVNATEAPLRVGVEPIGLSRRLVRVAPEQVELTLSARGQEKVKVTVTAPARADAAGASFKLRVYKVEDPEQAVESAAVGIALTPAAGPTPPPDVTPEPGPKIPWALIIGGAVAAVVLIGALVTFLVLRPGKVPTLVGLPLDDALAAISDAGLTPSVTEEVTGAAEAGHVIRQSPDAGAALPDNETVEVAIEMLSVPVPRVIGFNVRAASETLASAGLALGESEPVRTGRSPGGTVIGQEPRDGARAIPGSSVAITVEKELVRVPDLKGMAWQQAAASLKQDGLAIEKGAEVNSGARAGTVVSQAPAAGSELDAGETVVVQLETAKVAVPTVVGKPLQDAIRQVGSAGLALAPIQPLFKRTPPFDIVAAQSPGPGAQVPPGSAVTLQVNTQAVVLPGRVPNALIEQLQATRPLIKTPLGLRSVEAEK